MEYRTLGRSGCAVSTLCLGTMTFGREADERTAYAMLDRFREVGGNFLDTANVYVQGESEQVIGSWIRSRGCSAATSISLVSLPSFLRF